MILIQLHALPALNKAYFEGSVLGLYQSVLRVCSSLCILKLLLTGKASTLSTLLSLWPFSSAPDMDSLSLKAESLVFFPLCDQSESGLSAHMTVCSSFTSLSSSYASKELK